MNKMMEYMAFGLPIVAFDLKENRFSAQKAAVYATVNDIDEFASLIEYLLDNQEIRREIRELGIKRVRNELAWTYSKPHLISAYNRAINKGSDS